jgi:hypothetical protein
MEKIKMMKKLLLILLCLPMMFSSCKKEENEPSSNSNNTTSTGNTEYSDSTIELSIDQGPHTTIDGQITWDSHLKLTLEKNF